MSFGYPGKSAKKRSSSLAFEGPVCYVIESTMDPNFEFCACLVTYDADTHNGCTGIRAEGSKLCAYCATCLGTNEPRPVTFSERLGEELDKADEDDESIMAIRDKYLPHVMDKRVIKLTFDASGAPVGNIAAADRPALGYGLRYDRGFLTEETGRALLKQTGLLESLIKSKKRWFDVPNTHSRKMWWMTRQEQMDVLKETYGPLLRFDEKKKPNMEAAWVSERLVGEKVGEPVCGDALLRLFADEAGRYANCGVSLNFQHEEFSPHSDQAGNGGYGDAIATVSLAQSAEVLLFSARSGHAYSFTVEPNSCWGMRGEVMEAWWAHAVSAVGYPSTRKGLPTQHTGLGCPCRRSLNFRGISARHKAAMRTEAEVMRREEEQERRQQQQQQQQQQQVQRRGGDIKACTPKRRREAPAVRS